MMRRPPTALVIVALCARVALANEEGHHDAAGIPWGTLTLSTVNLLLFLWVLGRYVVPAVRNWVRERRVRVVGDLEAAAAAKAEALRLKAEWEARLARLDQTIEEMRAQALQDAERERQRILAAARKTADAIRRDAERAAAYEVRRTQELLRAELVRQALHAAEAQARSRWTAADQERFIADFLTQVRP
jgi:F-type H+-transporting ATPase subunit b